MSQIYIENLKKENEELAKKLKNKVQEESRLSEESVNVHEDQSTIKNVQNRDNIVTTQNLSLPSENKDAVNNSELIIKLEKRFKETMEKVAELTDEKQKLEHLVLQLQSETETIGKLYF